MKNMLKSVDNTFLPGKRHIMGSFFEQCKYYEHVEHTRHEASGIVM